jgi:hypothetical protein
VDDNGSFSTSAVSSSSSITVQVMFNQRNTLYSNSITFNVPDPGSIYNMGDITMRAGGQIKGRVKVSGGDFLSSGYIYFKQEGATGEGAYYSSSIDEQGYFILTGPPSTTLTNMRGEVNSQNTSYQTSLCPATPIFRNMTDIAQ